ncbi:MAG: hypothetical protein NC124_02345 [Clostridium sp.]|nr:hypothetical protein [Clostridium sp.]
MASVDEIISSLKGKIQDTAKGIATDITAELMVNTPIDTGFCASNWVASKGEPFTGLAGSRTSHSDVTVDRNPQQSGLSSLQSYTLNDGDIYITNNTDYIQKLNSGSSTQAPAGFVETAIDVAVNNWK